MAGVQRVHIRGSAARADRPGEVAVPLGVSDVGQQHLAVGEGGRTVRQEFLHQHTSRLYSRRAREIRQTRRTQEES
jgi:hypothetical protein